MKSAVSNPRSSGLAMIWVRPSPRRRTATSSASRRPFSVRGPSGVSRAPGCRRTHHAGSGTVPCLSSSSATTPRPMVPTPAYLPFFPDCSGRLAGDATARGVARSPLRFCFLGVIPLPVEHCGRHSQARGDDPSRTLAWWIRTTLSSIPATVPRAVPGSRWMTLHRPARATASSNARTQE
jgi:hypothetical protein